MTSSNVRGGYFIKIIKPVHQKGVTVLICMHHYVPDNRASKFVKAAIDPLRKEEMHKTTVTTSQL
jgi:hypothetical protein